jgi:hypothetical protein
MSGFRFGGRRILRDGSSSMISSASAQEKNEWRTEMTFDRVAALLSISHVARIGDWHSHNIPESDVPSDTDMRAWAGNLDALALPFYTGIIASPARHGGWSILSLAPWTVRREGYPSKLVCERARFVW